MINIFQVIDDQPVISPMGLHIPEMKAVWEADKTEDKSEAQKEFAYIFHMADWGSPYANLNVEERAKEVGKDYLGKRKPTKLVLAAIEKYKKLQTTPELRALNAADIMLDNLSRHFKGLDFNEKDEYGKYVNDSRKAIQNLKDLDKLVDSIKKLRKNVQLGLAELGANNGFGVTDNIIDEFLT